MKTARIQLVHQFKVTLRRIGPTIWRRIQVPAMYIFWGLHVAIQDAMGWLDCHLHAFRVRPERRRPVAIGIPDEWEGTAVLPGWEVPISRYFSEPGQVIEYEYDFGDSWLHDVLLEGILQREKGTSYPNCIGGARACPPEDCAGVSGYHRLLRILRDLNDPEFEETTHWLKSHAKNYYPYDPEKFEPNSVQFDNPTERWQKA